MSRPPQDMAPAVPRMGPPQVQQLMLYLLCVPRVQAAAVQQLDPRHFSIEPHFRLLWRVFVPLAKAHGIGAVPFDALYLGVDEAIKQPNAGVPPELAAMLVAMPDDVGRPLYGEVPDSPLIERAGILHHAYHAEDVGRLDAEYGLSLLRRFLHERAVVDAARAALVGTEEQIPGNFEDVVSKLREQVIRVRGVGRSVVRDFSTAPAKPRSLQLESTGLPVLDTLLEGGDCGGEVYMLFAPWKTGKSFLVLNMLVKKAELFYLQAQQGLPCKYAYYFSYELSDREVEHRVTSCAADIQLDRLMHEIHENEDYSRRGALLPYERDYYAKKGLTAFDELPGEWERYVNFHQTVGPHVRAVDFRGGAAEGGMDGVGCGGAAEIAALLAQERLDGRTPGLVIVDYTNRAVGAEIGFRGGREDREMRPGIIRFVRDSFSALAIPFSCPVWLVQQYSAEGNEASPGKKLKAAMAAEARTVGADVSAAICVGARDTESNVAQITLDLSRRTKTMGQTRLIQLDGNMARWRDVTGQFEVVETGGDAGRIRAKVGGAAKSAIDASAAAKLAKPAAHVLDPYQVEKQAAKGKKADDDPFFPS